MKLLSQQAVIISLRIYLLAALVAAAIMSPSALSAIGVIPIVAYILLWWLNRSHQAFLITEYFTFYIIVPIRYIINRKSKVVSWNVRDEFPAHNR